jgi:hypothetical protein
MQAKKRRQGVYRAVPAPPGRLDQLDLVHGLKEAQRRGKGHGVLLLAPLRRYIPGVREAIGPVPPTPGLTR